ncbi:MAG: DUF2497 domain-containing protein [Rickettsiales bacterium]|nr:DUF2497 domain-containing protein [Rickettsiales bacterium]
MFFKKKKDINDDILSQIKAKITNEVADPSADASDLLGSLMDTSDDIVIQNDTAAPASNSDESIDMLNNMVSDVISKNNQEQAEIENIAEDDILNNILEDTNEGAAPTLIDEQKTQTTVNDGDLLGELVSDNSAPASSESNQTADDDLLGNLLADEPQQVAAPVPVSEVQQTQQIEVAENYDDLLGNLLDDGASAKTEQEAVVKAEEEKFDANSLLDNLISKVDDSVLEDKPTAKTADNDIEETITEQFVPVKQTMVHKDEVPEEVAVADDKYDAVSDDLLNSVIGTAKDEKLIEQENEVSASQIADEMDEILEQKPKKVVEVKKPVAKVETKAQAALQVSSKIEEGTKNGVKRSITELIENVKNQIICERDSRPAQSSGKTLEEFTADLIQPKIVAFLNDNLERIVEDVVHREINKIIRGIDDEK